MNKSKEERIKKIKDLMEFDVNKKEKNENNIINMLYGNVETGYRFSNLLNDTSEILWDLGYPGLKIDKDEVLLVGKLINKIENIKFVQSREFEFFTEDGFINFLKSYRLYFFNIIRSLIEESKFYKSLSEKQQEKFDQEIEVMRKKIITPKGYEIDDLVKYYIDIAIQKKGVPATRDLEKSSEYKKDKWNKKILKNYDFVLKLNTELLLLSRKWKYKDSRWFKELFEYWQKELLLAQKRDKISSLKSHAKEFNDNIRTDENDF